MAELTCQFVRPDRLLFEGSVESIILATLDGELGIWPGHASEICALGDGIVRLNTEAGTRRIIVSGGYAEVDKDLVIILANHARAIDDIEIAQVQETKQQALAAMAEFGEDDSRRAYYQNKVAWCDLLLSHAHGELV